MNLCSTNLVHTVAVFMGKIIYHMSKIFILCSICLVIFPNKMRSLLCLMKFYPGIYGKNFLSTGFWDSPQPLQFFLWVGSLLFNRCQGIKQGLGSTEAAQMVTDERIVLAFFDPRVPFWMLELMAFMLNLFHKPNTCPLGKPDFNPVILCLNLFIPNSPSFYIQLSKFMASVWCCGAILKEDPAQVIC